MRFIKRFGLIFFGSFMLTALLSLFVTSAEVARIFNVREVISSSKEKRVGARPQQKETPLPTPTPVSKHTPAPTPTPVPVGTNAKRDGRASASTVGVVTTTNNGGSLSGQMLTPPIPRAVNLTAEGAVDWAHWGNGGSQVFDHKGLVNQQISNFTVIGTDTAKWLADNPTSFSWTNGTPNTAATNTQTGVFVIGVGNGFEVTAPADTSVRTLRLHVGLWRARGKLEATLSDASAPGYTDTSLSSNTGSTNGVYAISYSAASGGQTLRLKYTEYADYNAPNGNVTLEAATLVDGEDTNVFPIVNLSNPTEEATFNAGDSITISADAFDADGSIGKVEFYSGQEFLGTGTQTGTNQYSFTWNDVFAGSYALTAIATDDQGGKTTSHIVNVTALAVTGGSLSGRTFSPSAANPVNLTTEGTLDWAHWGIGDSQVFNHKIGVTQQISNITYIGTSTVNWLSDNPTTFNWTDGTPTATATNTATGIATNSVGNGFELSVPADTNLKTLRLYVGAWYARGRLEATLSDGSAPVFVDTSVNGDAGTVNGIYTISYSAASSGERLRIRYVVATDYFAPYGNITLEAATLVSGGNPNTAPVVSLTNPPNGSVVNALDNLILTAGASDADGTISKVEFFQGNTKIGQSTASPYSATWSSVPGGSYSVYAVATDNKGLTATSALANIQVNAAPVVNAGENQFVMLPASVSLYGTVQDDGLPTLPGNVTITWSKISGPGTVNFANPGAANTTANFSSEGSYVLRLTASDGPRSAYGEITVNAHTPAAVNLNPTADAHVRDGSSAATNFGSALTLEAQSSSTTGDNRDTYLKFDLTNVGDIIGAKLRLNAALSAAGSVTTSVYPVANTTWAETTINWNNKPTLGAPLLSSVTVNGTAFAWYELDVTNYLISEKSAGRNVVTLALRNPSASAPYIKINSRQATANKPELAIVTPETAFVTNKTTGTLRNNFTGFVGMKFTVGTSPLNVTSLGRIFVSGNSGTHIVKIVNASTGNDVVGASVSINMTLGSAANGFKYMALPAPITLAANSAYYIVSQEASGGDQWYDSNTILTTTGVASVNNAIQRSGTSWVAAGSGNNSYVPVDFKYSASTPPPSATYHLHSEASGITGRFQLKTAAPDAPSIAKSLLDLKGYGSGEYYIAFFDTQSGVPNKTGVIPTGATSTFTLWMKNAGTAGTMYPRVQLYLNDTSGVNLCTATGTTALTTTLTKYTLACSTSANISVTTADRYYLWVGVNLTAGSATKSVLPELYIEGSLNGNYDSQLVVPLPITPTLYKLSPNLGPAGTSVTITGANLGAMQGTSTVTFNGAAAVVSSWSSTSIVVQAPAGVSTGQVIVNVNGNASNGLTFTVGPADSDGDGLPDWWELQHFGNLNQGANGDYDNDGLTNIQEYKQGRNPTKGAVSDTTNLIINLKVFTPLQP